MIECAVFRAILRPAADVAEGCFFFGVVAGDFGPEGLVCASSLGFICMILRARLGGGGRSCRLAEPDSVLLRCITGEVGGDVPVFIAAGGRMNDPSISYGGSAGAGPVEVPGVGGNLARGMVSKW